MLRVLAITYSLATLMEHVIQTGQLKISKAPADIFPVCGFSESVSTVASDSWNLMWCSATVACLHQVWCVVHFKMRF